MKTVFILIASALFTVGCKKVDFKEDFHKEIQTTWHVTKLKAVHMDNWLDLPSDQNLSYNFTEDRMIFFDYNYGYTVKDVNLITVKDNANEYKDLQIIISENRALFVFDNGDSAMLVK